MTLSSLAKLLASKLFNYQLCSKWEGGGRFIVELGIRISLSGPPNQAHQRTKATWIKAPGEDDYNNYFAVGVYSREEVNNCDHCAANETSKSARKLALKANNNKNKKVSLKKKRIL